MKRSKGSIVIILALASIVIAILAIGSFLAISHAQKSKIYYDYIQDAYVASFYQYSFRMDAMASPEVDPSDPVPDWDFWATVFHRVEYVKEFQPEAEREWAVIYIMPGLNTEGRVSELNDIVKDDTDIKIDERLSLPLTVEQILYYPDAVMEIVKQLDRRQWEKFYHYDSDIRKWNAKYYAWGAGINEPKE